jgi:L-asparaginase / beta-aspartyl-peptidase
MTQSPEAPSPFVIVVHGGAGTLSRAELAAPHDAPYHDGLRKALEAGYEVLVNGGSSLEAVTGAVVRLEDCPLFNAGHGAALNARGTHELDAAVMDGATLYAGAVSAATRVRNPVRLARAIMERSPHVLLTGTRCDAQGGVNRDGPRSDALRAEGEWI